MERLIRLQELASQYGGGGLKPELLALLQRDDIARAQGATPLKAPQISAGPTDQFATREQLDQEGIPVLSAVRTDVSEDGDINILDSATSVF